ncbi:MAG: bacteriohemerythrin [Cellulosilyticaceae bacterium]
MAFDFKFDWVEEVAVGVTEVDEQHKELFRMIRDLEQKILIKCVNVSTEQVIESICEVRNYVTYHFYTEEQIMRSNQCIRYAYHKSEHDRFIALVNRVYYNEEVHTPLGKMIELRTLLENIFFEHILIEDFKTFKKE